MECSPITYMFLIFVYLCGKGSPHIPCTEHLGMYWQIITLKMNQLMIVDDYSWFSAVCQSYWCYGKAFLGRSLGKSSNRSLARPLTPPVAFNMHLQCACCNVSYRHGLCRTIHAIFIHPEPLFDYRLPTQDHQIRKNIPHGPTHLTNRSPQNPKCKSLRIPKRIEFEVVVKLVALPAQPLPFFPKAKLCKALPSTRNLIFLHGNFPQNRTCAGKWG